MVLFHLELYLKPLWEILMHIKLLMVLVTTLLTSACVYTNDGVLTITEDSMIRFAGSYTVVTVVNKTACHLHLTKTNGMMFVEVPRYGIATIKYGRLSASRRSDEFVITAIAYVKNKRVGNHARSFRINKRGGINAIVWNIRSVGCPYS